MIRSARSALLLPPALILLAAAGCGISHPELMQPVRTSLYRNEPVSALADYSSAGPDSIGRDRLLYLMEMGNLLRLSGRFRSAIDLLLEADRLTDTMRGVDLGEQVEAMLTSDEALSYRGADYESVMINYCLAACYAATGDIEDALVECRRVNEKLREFNLEYGEGGSNRYSDDAFIRYMMGVLFESAGELDDALVAYRASLRVYSDDYAIHYGLPPSEQLKMDLLRLSHRVGYSSLHDSFVEQWPGLPWQESGADAGQGRGEIVVFIERGLIPERVEVSVEAWYEGRVYRLAVPAIRASRRSYGSVRVSAGEWSSSAFLAEDLAAIAEKNLEDHAARDMARAIGRLASKVAIAEAGEEIVEEIADEEDDGCWSEGTGFLLSLLGAATEKADLRSWLTLPSTVHIARLALPEGEYPLTIVGSGSASPLFHTDSFQVRAGRMDLLFVRSGR
jgi:hypothetical protein